MKKLLAMVLLILITCTAAAFAGETQWRTDWQQLVGVDYLVKMPEGYYLLNKHTKDALKNDVQAYEHLKRAQGEDFLYTIIADRKNAIMSDDGRLCVRFELIDYNDTAEIYSILDKMYHSVISELQENGCTEIDRGLYQYGEMGYEFVCAFGEGASVGDGDINGHFLMANVGEPALEFWAYNMDRETMEEILSSFLAMRPLPDVEVIDRSIPAYATFGDTPSLNRKSVWENRFEVISNEVGVSISGAAANYRSPDDGQLQLPALIDDLPVVQIGKNAFCGCSDTRVLVPASVQRICSGAFSEMDMLTQVVLENGVEIIEDSFNQCPRLMQVSIPASVKRISENAFDLRNSYFHFTVEKGSYAEQYAKEHSIPYTYAKDRNGVSLSCGNTVTFGTRDGTEIEWLVLEVEENQALLLAKDELATQCYSRNENVQWHNSYIRNYLNDDLLFELFSSEEAEIIAAHRIYDPASPYALSAEPGQAEFCCLFLLSYYEARDWLPDDAHRATGEEWLLRTSDDMKYAHTVSDTGEVQSANPYSWLSGIRPAVWVRTDQAKGILKVVDDDVWVVETPAPDDGVLRKGSVIRLGSYEQDGNLENGMEPLDWVVLNVRENSALLITEDCIDVQKYDTSREAVSWSDTQLRDWLNRDFLNTAFTDTEKTALIETDVETSEWDIGKRTYLDSDQFPPDISRDLVWILDISEARSFFPRAEDQLASASRYAADQGALRNSEDHSVWLLRTYKNDDVETYCMVPYDRLGRLVPNEQGKVCVRPVVCVDLEKIGTDEWEVTPTPSPTPRPRATPQPTPTPIPTPSPTPDLTSVLAAMEGLGFTEPADGITIQVGKKLPLAWTEIPGAKCYSVKAYPAGMPSYNISWMTILYDGETSVVIPRSTLTEPSYTIELNAWKDDRLTGGREIFTASITVYTENKFADPAGSAN